MEETLEVLKRCQHERRVLLNFILSSSLIKKVIMPPGVASLDDVDLDQVNVDDVVNCAKKGEPLELLKAQGECLDTPFVPRKIKTSPAEEILMIRTQLTSTCTSPRSPRAARLPSTSTSPRSPRTARFPSMSASPSVPLRLSRSQPNLQELLDNDSEDLFDEHIQLKIDSIRASRRQADFVNLMLELPAFETGISDADLCESAYEILLASIGATGGLKIASKEKKKAKKHRFLKKLVHRGNRSHRALKLSYFLEIVRVHLEISDAMEARTSERLLNAVEGREGKRMDMILIPLELLCRIQQAEFPDKKAYMRWQKRQLNLLEEGLLNHPAVEFVESGRIANELRNSLRQIEESEFLPPPACEVQRTKYLRSVREISLPLSERLGPDDPTDEVCHWADGYHLNVALYEKLLYSVFDILDEGKLAVEAEEILCYLKSTWRILGITQTIHGICYVWVLFRQFVVTNEQLLLEHAIEKLREQSGSEDRLHVKRLRSSVGSESLTFFQSFLLPIQKWADQNLRDYHMHFAEGPTTMEGILIIASITRKILSEELHGGMVSNIVIDEGQIEAFVSSSMKQSFSRILLAAEATEGKTDDHLLASLAEEAKKLFMRDSLMFMPILSRWNPKAPLISASVLHKLYGSELFPFLGQVEYLSKDAISVLPAAGSLEQCLMGVISSICEEETAKVFVKEKLSLYQVESISGKLVMRWLNSQLGRVLEWVERASEHESWDPMSAHIRHGSSIVDVFRITEETVDQFFALKVPIRSSEMSSLLTGLDNAFQLYTHQVTDKLGLKDDLIPPVPPLTRCKKESGIKAFVKKDTSDSRSLDERRINEINMLSTSKLCIRLNTLHYAVIQLNKIEDSIWEHWKRRTQANSNTKMSMDDDLRNFYSDGQKTVFPECKKDIRTTIDEICKFTGSKIIFWDMRESFINNLYKNSVSESRLDALVEQFDVVLNELCGIIVKPLRDHIVTALLQASLDGLVRVLLDGGPSRVFFPSDAKLLKEDLEILKEFFVSGGDGLSQVTVEDLSSHVHFILKLHGQETNSLIDELTSTIPGTPRSIDSLGPEGLTILRILCHRSDKDATHFLKKHYKLPCIPN